MNTALAHGRHLVDAARDLRAAGSAPALAEFLERVNDLIADTGAVMDCDVPRAMDDLRALADPTDGGTW